MEEMTEYERRRLENVQRNQQMLAALCVQDTAQYLLSASKKPKSEPKGYKPPKREREPEPAVLRRSLRTSSLQSIGILGSHRRPAKLRKGLIALSPGSPIAPRSSKKKAPRSSKKRPLSLAETYVPHEEEVSYDRYLKRIIEISDHAPSADFMCAEPGRRSEGGGHVGPEFSSGDLKLETKDVARVTPNKIFSVHILPCRERVIVASGDKDGYLSLWDADWEEEGDGVQIYEPHAAPVTGIATAAFSVQKVFSCSYDGFIRCMDIEKEVFHMLYTNKTDAILSAICCAPQGYQSVYFAEAAGRMKVLDLRVRGVSNSYDLHEKRINSIDINPHNPHLVSTSSNDCTASIWDVRKMRKRKSESIATVQHDREVHSAYFSPSGNYLATSSDDDNVGLWHGLDSWNTTMIYQYNPPPRRWISSFSNDDNVGLLHGLDSWNTTMIDQYNPPRRWITSFRAIWGWDDQYLFIGNLNKALDAICITTMVTTTLHSSLMKATPTRLAKHPFSYGILAGATSGGQVYVWRKH